MLSIVSAPALYSVSTAMPAQDSVTAAADFLPLRSFLACSLFDSFLSFTSSCSSDWLIRCLLISCVMLYALDGLARNVPAPATQGYNIPHNHVLQDVSVEAVPQKQCSAENQWKPGMTWESLPRQRGLQRPSLRAQSRCGRGMTCRLQITDTSQYPTPTHSTVVYESVITFLATPHQQYRN